jgi:hypothetical protein
MQNMHKIKSQEWLRQQLEKSKVNLVDMLPSKGVYLPIIQIIKS